MSLSLYDKIVIGSLLFGFGSLVFAGSLFIWGLTMLENSFDRQEQLRAEMWEYEHVTKPQQEAMFESAKEAGFTNNDLISNSTSLCWYNMETNTFFGNCAELKKLNDIGKYNVTVGYGQSVTWVIDGVEG